MTKSTNDQISASNHLDGGPTLSRRRILLWLALLLAFSLALWVQWPDLTNPNSTQDDFRGYYWFNLFQEPELYPDDLNPATYRNTELQLFGLEFGLLFDILNSLRAGYHLLFFLVSPLFSPILFNKLLIFPLILALTYYAFRIGQELKGDWTGFALAMTFVVFNLASEDSISVAPGLPRSFATPILLALIYYLMMKRYLAAGIVVASSGLIYAPVFVLSLATFILALLQAVRAGAIKPRFNWRAIVVLLLLGITSLIILPKAILIVSYFWSRISIDSNIWGLLGNPLYQPGGRYHLFGEYLFVGRGGIFTKISNFWQTMALFLLALSTWLLVPRQERILSKALKQLLIAAVACFVAAWLAIILASFLTLYYPSRYLRATLPIVFLIFTVTNLELALRSAGFRFNSLIPVLRAAVLIVLAAWMIAITFLLRQDLSSFLKTVPNQRVEWLLVIASAFAIGALLLYLLGSVQIVQQPKRLSGFQRLVAFFIVCLVAAIGAIYLIGRNQNHGYLQLSTSHGKYLDFVKTLPKDVKLASGSCVLDDVPMFARRQVLWNCEGISSSKEVMIIDTLKAYYAPSLDDVLNFCHQYEVDYFVISNDAFEEGRVQIGNYPFAPYRSFLKAEAGSQASHVLGDIPDRMRVYENEEVIVMQCALANNDELASQGTQVDGLSILAHDEISGTQTQAGEVETTIKWLADKEMLADYDVCFSVKERSGESRQKVCEPLSPDLPINQWSIPEIRYETYNLQISPYLKSGDYSIVASVNSGEETDNSSEIVFGEITYTALPRTFNTAEINPESDYDVIWGDQISMLGYDLPAVDESDETVRITIYWQALRRMDTSYTAFLHLENPATGEIVSQADVIPRGWSYPTSWWEAGEVVEDAIQLPLEGVPPGEYQIFLGWYNMETGERLGAISETGETFAEDRVPITSITR